MYRLIVVHAYECTPPHNEECVDIWKLGRLRETIKVVATTTNPYFSTVIDWIASELLLTPITIDIDMLYGAFTGGGGTTCLLCWDSTTCERNSATLTSHLDAAKIQLAYHVMEDRSRPLLEEAV